MERSRSPHVPHSLAPGSQSVCYLPWLKVSVALRYVRTFPWASEACGRFGSTFPGSWQSRVVYAGPDGSTE